MSYQDYLQTDHWKKKRHEKISKTSHCQICDADKNLHIHHKFYERDHKSILYNERVYDLVTLCGSCHKLLHHHFGIEVKKLNKKILRIKRLIDLGVPKKRAFYFATQTETFYRVRDYMTKKI